MKGTYQQYLQSKDWQRKRRAKLGRSNGTKRRCGICGSTEQLDIHHLSYRKDLTKVKQCDLRILCRTCHNCAHDLMKAGVLKFSSPDHNHRFTLTKMAVKKALSIDGNQFRERAREPEVLKALQHELGAMDARFRMLTD